MDTKTIGAGVIGIALATTIAIAVPEGENPTYKTVNGKIEVSRTICDPFSYTATKEEIIQKANFAQSLIDAQKVLGVDLDQDQIDVLEKYKSRFIQDATQVEKI